MAVFRSRKLGEFPEKGKSRVARVFRKGKVTSWESYSHITYPHKSFRVDLKMWRFSEVRNWESFPKTESHQLGELLKYHLPT
ncbi:hypothetical protein [Limnospira platensis]|uniref:hypothetical protein n=1 Tax=Limnospira platensis TaxID=118562 RepID=UPI0001D0EC28|nr:hypothetical protein [Arthrospira platensis NCB002]WAK73777.1 hypothetical protein AP9108_21245 [Arthrospira sp. PCC 9108]BAI92211.1 hypothetical protein NIES39_L00500 [Arthrospira platensis NIES-39]